MGNSESQSFSQRFHSKYNFNQLFDDPNFGNIKIYRKKQLNYDYVMILEKYVHPSELKTLINQIKIIHESFLKPDEPMALRIFNYEVFEDRWSECKLPLVRLYVEYFNFTLHDLIQKNHDKGYVFSSEEILYIIHAILHTYEFFSRLNSNMVIINSKCIYLSPEGVIKLSPVKAHDFHQDPDAFCRALCYETKEKDVAKFQRRDKQLLSDIKRLMVEISKLYYKIDHKNKTKCLIKQIQKKSTLLDLKKFVQKPQIEALSISKKEGQTTDSMGSRNQPHQYDGAFLSGDENSSGKRSIKKQKSVS